MRDDIADLLRWVGSSVEVEDWSGVCGEVMMAGQVDIRGCKGCGWIRWERELESDRREHGEDVVVVGGDAGGVVERRDGADGDRGVLCRGEGAGVVLWSRSQYAGLAEVGMGPTNLHASSDGDFS